MSSGPPVSSRRSATAFRQRAWHRVRSSVWAVAQQAAAAGVAWVLAGQLAEQRHPFFAPIAAVVALNTPLGRRGRQAVHLLTGVLVGIAVGVVALRLLGSQALALVVATLVAMLAGVAVGAARVTIAQAAAGAILTVTVPYGGGGGLPRLFDAAVGVAVALVFSQLLFPTHPLRLLDRAEHTLLAHTHELLTQTAEALAQDAAIEGPSAPEPAAEAAARTPAVRADDARESDVREAVASTRGAVADLDLARSASLNVVHRTRRRVGMRRQTHARVAAGSPLEDAAMASMLMATTGLAAPADAQVVLAPVIRDAAQALGAQKATENRWAATVHRAQTLHETLPEIRSRLDLTNPATGAALGAVHVLLDVLRRPAGS